MLNLLVTLIGFFAVSHKFGFGLMDGEAMVNLAEQWTSVPAQHICKTPVIAENRLVQSSTEEFLFK